MFGRKEGSSCQVPVDFAWFDAVLESSIHGLLHGDPFRIAILGRNGMGKSYLINLLLRMSRVSPSEYTHHSFRAGTEGASASSHVVQQALDGAHSRARAACLARGLRRAKLRHDGSHCKGVLLTDGTQECTLKDCQVVQRCSFGISLDRDVRLRVDGCLIAGKASTACSSRAAARLPCCSSFIGNRCGGFRLLGSALKHHRPIGPAAS